MELFFFLLGLLLLAFPIIAIVALVKSIGLGERLRRLEARFGLIEGTMAVLAPSKQAPRPAPTGATLAASAAHPSAVDEPPAGAEPPPATSATPAAATPPSPEPQAPPTASLPRPPPQTIATSPSMSLEERLGTQWAVWIGGLALALGGIFLVRYSIEQGLLGPRVRGVVAALFAAALIIAGEWARRTEGLAGIAGLPRA